MSRFESYTAVTSEAFSMRRWIVVGLFASLVLHAGLLYVFYRQQLSGFNLNEQPAAPPLRAFTMKRVSVPDAPKPEEQRLSLPSEMAPQSKSALSLPSDKPPIDELSLAPQTKGDLPKQLFADAKPKMDMASLDQAMKSTASARSEADKELSQLANSLLKEGPTMPHQPTIAVGRGTPGAGNGGEANANIPGVASVDDMLSKAGGLRTGDRAAMSGGALFEYDQYELRAEAQDALSKVGELIRQNPKATFVIEGHTDSFGSPDYNQKLSQLRAESVKAWLVQAVGVSPDRIQTVGYGNAKPLVPAEKSKEEQAPNRRVEIVVKMNRKA